MDTGEIIAEITKMMESHMEQTKRLIDDQTLLINLKIENDVTKRIDSLFDGYKLTHEKQWELERKVDLLEKRIERLEITAC